MKRACPCLAGAFALALALLVANVPAPALAQEKKAPLKRNPDSPYAHTAIGAVVDANGGKVPTSGAELVAALAKLGNFAQLPVSFSAVALDSGLTHPRVVFTQSPSITIQVREWNSSGTSTRTVVLPPDPINHIEPNHTQLQSRLFLAANTEVGPDGLKVRTVEFISWNTRKLKFDFGAIEGMHTDQPELKILDGVRCFSCHKNKGPIMGITPWSNTMHDDVVRTAALNALHMHLKVPLRTELPISATDGLSFKSTRALPVDIAVRLGAAVPRDRAMFKRLAEAPDTQKALVVLFESLLRLAPPEKADQPGAPDKAPKPESLEKIDKAIQGTLDTLIPVRLARDARNNHLNGPSCGLRDFSPVGRGVRTVDVMRYDETRAKGQSRLPSEFQPSNPKAFAEPQVRGTRPSDFMNATVLAQTMGLSEGDRLFLSGALDETVKRLKNPALTRDAVAHTIFTGPAFADVLATGTIPDRDDFKDRFVAGIRAALKAQKVNDEFWKERDTYASAPKFDPSAKEEKELVALPSHACMACHDVPSTRKAFNPIPVLPFDPFDTSARAEWLKTTDRKRKVENLGRLLKRIGTDKDMPPTDSTEHELFRAKDPAALNAVKDWLDAELKKLK
jgi:hypothetical protein